MTDSELSPKHQFCQNTEDTSKFAEMINNPAMKRAITYCMADLTFSSATADELNGARKFVTRFVSFHEFNEPKQLPQKSLKTL